jgi:hypothetical protein
MKHKCPVDGCAIQVPADKLMCLEHWSLVPKALGDTLYRAYRSAPHSNVHYAAMQACTDHVNNFLASQPAPKTKQPRLL